MPADFLNAATAVSTTLATLIAAFAIFLQTRSNRAQSRAAVWSLVANQSHEINIAFEEAKAPGPADSAEFVQRYLERYSSGRSLADGTLTNLLFHQANLLLTFYVNQSVLTQSEVDGARRWSRQVAHWARRFRGLDEVRENLRTSHDLYPDGLVEWMIIDGWFDQSANTS